MSNHLIPELHEAAQAIASTPGFTVHVLPSARVTGESWFIVARNGNVGTVQYDRLNGYAVSFEIKPSREYGSSLLVSVPCGPGEEALDPRANRGERDPRTVAEIVAAATIATEDTYSNFATRAGALRNHGWPHFAWTRGRLVQLAADEI